MPQANAKIVDPFRKHKFGVYFEGKKEMVALLSYMSPLTKTTEVVDFRDGGMSNTIRRLPGFTKYDPVTLKRGLSLDADFEDWANLVNSFGTDLAKKDNDFRKELRIEVLDVDGEKKLEYEIHRCWVSKYIAVPVMDANTNEVAIEEIQIQNEGWENTER